MAEGLRLKVEADLSQAEKALDDFAKTAQKDGQIAATSLSNSLNKIEPSANKAAAGINNVSNAAKKAKFNMVDVSRVVQDLPFGFTAISNNLTQLIPGVGFLGLAFSGLVAALTFSQVGLSAWSRGSHGAKQAADDLSPAVKKVRDEQEAFAKAMDDAASATINEAGRIDDLRKTLVDTSDKYNILTESVIKHGIAQALFSEKEGIIQKQIARYIGDRLKIEKEIASVKEFTNDKIVKDSIPAEINGLKVIGVVEDANLKKLREKSKVYQQEKEQIADINEIARKLGLNFDQFIKQDKTKKPKIEAEVRLSIPDRLDTPFADLNKVITLDIQGIKFRETAKTDMEKEFDKLAKGLKPAEVTFKVKQDQAALDKIAKDFKALTDKVFTTFEQAATDSLANLGEAIGTAIAGGDLSKVFANFGNIIGGAIQQIGKQLIEFGTLAILTKKALASVFANPSLAIGVGIALSALGAVIKSSLSKGVTGFAQGGLVFGPTMGLVGEGIGTRPSNPEVIAPLDKLKGFLGSTGGGQMVVVMGRLRGNDILLSNNRTGRQNRRNGS